MTYHSILCLCFHCRYGTFIDVRKVAIDCLVDFVRGGIQVFFSFLSLISNSFERLPVVSFFEIAATAVARLLIMTWALTTC